MNFLGTVGQLWRYPVKSMQGHVAESLDVGPAGVSGDRNWALIDRETGRLLSAKRVAALLDAVGGDEVVTLPGDHTIRLGASDASERLSDWLDRPVTLASLDDLSGSAERLSYEMTFDPPNDAAEYVEIPAPAHSFQDLAPLHLVTTTTLQHCRRERPDLDWDVRRFRPNLVLDTGTGLDARVEPFVENGWDGAEIRLGSEVVIRVIMATVRCAMPLRAQPGLERQPELFQAMTDLNERIPNHLGAYAEVISPGRVRRGDPVEAAV